MNYNVKALLEKATELWPTKLGTNHCITLSTNEEFDLALHIIYNGYNFSVVFTEDELQNISWLKEWKANNCISDGVPDFLTRGQRKVLNKATEDYIRGKLE